VCVCVCVFGCDGLDSIYSTLYKRSLNSTVLWDVTPYSASIFRVDSLRIEADICLKPSFRLGGITSLNMIMFLMKTIEIEQN
jgi:hypothetical protein